MRSPPTVSIVIAAYNAQDTIRGAIAAALNQTGIDVEVIVIDDCSTDQTREVVAQIVDPRLVLLRLDKNGGPSAARNAGLAHARGEWLAVLDADDAMEPDRLRSLIETAEAYPADIIADNMLVVRGEDTSLFIPETLDMGIEPITLGEFAMHNRLFEKGRGYGYLKPVTRRSFLTRNGLAYDERLRIAEDFVLIAEMLAHGAVYIRRRSASYSYRVAAGSISHRLSTVNADAMVRADQRFIAEHKPRMSADERSAMARHLKSLKDGLAFSKMVDAAKNRQAAQLLAEALKRPLALRHFSMPVVARLSALRVKFRR